MMAIKVAAKKTVLKIAPSFI